MCVLIGALGSLYVRLRVQVGPDGITVSNLLRDSFVRWGDVRDIRVGAFSLQIVTEGRTFGVYSIQIANRESRGKSRADRIANALSKVAPKSGLTGSGSWSRVRLPWVWLTVWGLAAIAAVAVKAMT